MKVLSHLAGFWADSGRHTAKGALIVTGTAMAIYGLCTLTKHFPHMMAWVLGIAIFLLASWLVGEIAR